MQNDITKEVVIKGAAKAFCFSLQMRHTEAAIAERIKGVYAAKSKPLRDDTKIRLVSDLENRIKAGQSAGLEQWTKINMLILILD